MMRHHGKPTQALNGKPRQAILQMTLPGHRLTLFVSPRKTMRPLEHLQDERTAQ